MGAVVFIRLFVKKNVLNPLAETCLKINKYTKFV